MIRKIVEATRINKNKNKNDFTNNDSSISLLCNSQIAQRQLFCQLQLSKHQNCIPSFNSVAFREFSQFDEDGIILYLFAIIGFTNKYCLDVAFAKAYGANTTNLILNWGFSGTLVCGDEGEKLNAKAFFKSNEDTWLLPPQIIQSWVTAENICETLSQNNVPKEIDFFSLDMDGVDYWVLKSILSEIAPRVIVVESLNFWKDEKAVVAKYSKDFDRFKTHEDYFGASILAYVKLMKEHNYRMVACNKYGFNLFFVKEELCNNYLPELRAEDCINGLPDYYIKELDKRRDAIKDLDWLEV
jgi:hypothetical protein